LRRGTNVAFRRVTDEQEVFRPELWPFGHRIERREGDKSEGSHDSSPSQHDISSRQTMHLGGF
jgi:hypothetical protein